MDTRLLTPTKKLLSLAAKRVQLPGVPILSKFDEEENILYLRFTNENPVISNQSKLDDGVIFDLDAQNRIVSIEIFDIYENESFSI